MTTISYLLQRLRTPLYRRFLINMIVASVVGLFLQPMVWTYGIDVYVVSPSTIIIFIIPFIVATLTVVVELSSWWKYAIATCVTTLLAFIILSFARFCT